MVHWLEQYEFTDERKQRLCQELGINEDDFQLNLQWIMDVVLPKVLELENGCTITLCSPDLHRDFPRKYWNCRIDPIKCKALFSGWISQEENTTPILAIVKAIAVAYQVW